MSKIARVKFIRDKEPNIKALTAENKVLDGALYVATDTGTLWMGISSSSLIQIKDNINTNTTYNLTKSGNTITLRGSDGSTFNVTDSNTVYGNATASAAGLMSAADKAKLDGVAAGSNHVTVDAELSTTSTNPVQNKVIKSALDGKSNTGHTHDDRYYTETEINTKLNGKSNTGHKHVKADITDFPTSMPASDVSAWAKAATKPSYSKAEVGLGNVDNTADSAKSVKYATSAGSAGSVAWSNVSGRPSSMPASDVYSWAKQPNKPSYTASEVGAAPASHSHSYLPLAGGTVTGKINRGAGGTWISARNNVVAFGTTANSTLYNPVVGQKTSKGAWTVGNLAGDERLVFSYDTDTNFNASKNSSNQTYLPVGGDKQEIITSATIGSQSVNHANTAGSVAWSNVSGRPTIPSVGNGTVTITQNGATKGTFTLNQAGNATIALTDNNTVYSLPTATSSVLGGVKVGSNITNSSGTISLTKANVTAALGYTPPTSDTNTWRPEEVIISSTQPSASTCKLWIKV